MNKSIGNRDSLFRQMRKQVSQYCITLDHTNNNHHRRLLNRRQHYTAGGPTAEPDTLRRLFIVILLSVHNILDVRLRVAVVQRKEGRLHLDHDSMAPPKYVVHVGQFPCVALHFAWLEWRGLRKAFQVAAAEDLNTDR